MVTTDTIHIIEDNNVMANLAGRLSAAPNLKELWSD
jgi:hypothetical protein